MSKIDKLLEEIGSLTVLEASELKTKMEETFGVSAAAPVAVAAAAPAGAEAAAEQDEFDVILSGVGDKKIQVIKAVREVTSLGLKEAKDLVDNAPKPVLEKVPKDQADQAKEKIEAAGGSVSVK
jgi:large subunit ribosomal protein L7/L12